jgi:hypothetical protein
MTMPIIDTDTAMTAATDRPLRSSVPRCWWPEAASACMAIRIIGTRGRLVHLARGSGVRLALAEARRDVVVRHVDRQIQDQ